MEKNVEGMATERGGEEGKSASPAPIGSDISDPVAAGPDMSSADVWGVTGRAS